MARFKLPGPLRGIASALSRGPLARLAGSTETKAAKPDTGPGTAVADPSASGRTPAASRSSGDGATVEERKRVCAQTVPVARKIIENVASFRKAFAAAFDAAPKDVAPGRSGWGAPGPFLGTLISMSQGPAGFVRELEQYLADGGTAWQRDLWSGGESAAERSLRSTRAMCANLAVFLDRAYDKGDTTLGVPAQRLPGSLILARPEIVKKWSREQLRDVQKFLQKLDEAYEYAVSAVDAAARLKDLPRLGEESVDEWPQGRIESVRSRNQKALHLVQTVLTRNGSAADEPDADHGSAGQAPRRIRSVPPASPSGADPERQRQVCEETIPLARQIVRKADEFQIRFDKVCGFGTRRGLVRGWAPLQAFCGMVRLLWEETSTSLAQLEGCLHSSGAPDPFRSADGSPTRAESLLQLVRARCAALATFIDRAYDLGDPSQGLAANTPPAQYFYKHRTAVLGDDPSRSVHEHLRTGLIELDQAYEVAEQIIGTARQLRDLTHLSKENLDSWPDEPHAAELRQYNLKVIAWLDGQISMKEPRSGNKPTARRETPRATQRQAPSTAQRTPAAPTHKSRPQPRAGTQQQTHAVPPQPKRKTPPSGQPVAASAPDPASRPPATGSKPASELAPL